MLFVFYRFEKKTFAFFVITSHNCTAANIEDKNMYVQAQQKQNTVSPVHSVPILNNDLWEKENLKSAKRRKRQYLTIIFKKKISWRNVC